MRRRCVKGGASRTWLRTSRLRRSHRVGSPRKPARRRPGRRTARARRVAAAAEGDGQDIAIPLGIRQDMPLDAALAGIERVWTMGWPFGVKRPLKKFRFIATDVDWAAGNGPEV